MARHGSAFGAFVQSVAHITADNLGRKIATCSYNTDDSRASETVTDQNANGTTNWTYDGEGRVSKEVLSGFDDANNPIAYSDIYKYDFSSNRIELDHTDQTPGGIPGSDGPTDVITSTYDGNDRLLSEANRNFADSSKNTFTTFAYGPGNETSDQTSSTTYQGLDTSGAITHQTTYSYDAIGNMIGAAVTNGNTTTSVSYAYDSSGFRVEQTENGVRTVYLVDPQNPTGYSQVLEEGTDTNNNHKLDAAEVQKAYTIGMKVLAQATASQVLHLITDAHGSTVAVMNLAAGATPASILQRYAYNAYGEDLGLATPLTAMRYAGQMIDLITGLSYNRARWYSPVVGAFTQIDPSAGENQEPITFNKYVYANGDPANNMDPTGNTSIAELAVSMGIGDIIDEAQRLYKAKETAVKDAKMIVRLALVESLGIGFGLGLSDGQMAFEGIYHAYEEGVFEETYKSEEQGDKLVAERLASAVEYIASLARSVDMSPGELPELQNSFLRGDLKGNKQDIKYVCTIP